MTTLSGALYGTDTVDTYAMVKQRGTYAYSIKVWGGGNVHLKVEYYTGDQIGLDADTIKGSWKTIEERIKVESDHTTTGSFTIPAFVNKDGNEGSREVKVKLSRGVLTKGADYRFERTD